MAGAFDGGADEGTSAPKLNPSFILVTGAASPWGDADAAGQAVLRQHLQTKIHSDCNLVHINFYSAHLIISETILTFLI